MIATIKLAIWVLTGLLAVTSVFFNQYIFLMNVSNYKQNKCWTSSETIISALSVASMAHQLVCYFWMTMDEIDRECKIAETPYSVMLLLIFSLKFTVIWTTSFLTYYYNKKLVTTTRECSRKIHTTILRHVTLVVYLIPLCGVATCMPMLAVLHHDNDTRANDDCGVMMPDTMRGKIYEAMHLVVADVLPGLFMIKFCVSISVHLAVHLRNMKASSNGAHCPKLGAQLRVIKMALSLVFIFLCFVVVDLYVHYQIAVHHENVIVLTFFFTSVYTTASAMVLVYGKKALWKALLHSYNVFLDEYPCLSCLKISEEKTKSISLPKIKSTQ